MSDLLLDTCALIWLADGGGKLSKKAISLINGAPFVYTSSISAWEVSLLCSKKQLKFATEPEEWFEKFTVGQDIKILNLSSEIAFLSNKLPWHHKDPADRFIIATGKIHNLDIVTATPSLKSMM